MGRVAVVMAADVRDPRVWSGMPKNLADALEALGHDVVRISAAPSMRVRGLLRRARVPHWAQCCLNTIIGRSRLRRSAPVDAVVQIGTDFTLRTHVPTATFEDMTVIQHIRFHDEWFMSFSSLARRAWLRRQKFTYKNATACCVLSRWAATSLVEDYGVPEEMVHVVGAGGNHSITASRPIRDFAVPHFLIIAGDWRRKNVPAVIEAFRLIRTEQPEATLDVVGPYPGAGVPGVVLHGTLSLGDVRQRAVVEDLYRHATCYVMPSMHEAGGLVFLDAASAGLPSIAGSVGGCAEFVGDGGIVIDPHDPPQLVDAMRRLSNEDTARELGARALRHVAWYQWPKVARRVAASLGL